MAIDMVSAYRNVCRDLRGLEAYEPIARKRLEREHATLFKGKAPSSGSMCYVRLDQQIPHYNAAVDDYNETLEAIRHLQLVKGQMEQTIANMSDLEQVVLLLSVEQNMSLREIAKKTNYTYDHVCRISAKVRKMPANAG